MPELFYGRHTAVEAAKVNSKRVHTTANYNYLTQRPKAVQFRTLSIYVVPTKIPSSNITTAGIKSLRLFRHICRMIPFILKTQEM